MELALQEQKRANEDLKQELKDQDELIGKSKGQLISKCPFRVLKSQKIFKLALSLPEEQSF